MKHTVTFRDRSWKIDICFEFNVKGVRESLGIIYLMLELPSGKEFLLPTVNEITPFLFTIDEKDYYINAYDLMRYQQVWSNDVAKYPTSFIEWCRV